VDRSGSGFDVMKVFEILNARLSLLASYCDMYNVVSCFLIAKLLIEAVMNSDLADYRTACRIHCCHIGSYAEIGFQFDCSSNPPAHCQ